MYIKRQVYDKLIQWKNDGSRTTLEVNGARQVGKTYIIDKFANENFKHVIYINLFELSGEQFVACYRKAMDWQPGQALALLKQYNQEPFHILHALTVEGTMRWYAKELGYGDEERTVCIRRTDGTDWGGGANAPIKKCSGSGGFQPEEKV